MTGGNLNLNPTGGPTACSLRSNGGVLLSGNVNAYAIYAGGSITGSANATKHANDGTVADPYASNASIQAAFNQLTTQTTKTASGGTLQPGTYASLNLTSNTTLQPGLYVVTGNLSVGTNTNVSGTGVSLVVGGTVSLTGSGSNFNVTAPGTSPTGGGISGLLLADNSTNGVTFGYSAAVTGVVYVPNGPVVFSGNGGGNGSCFEVIAKTVSVNANVSFGGSCSSLGATSFGSVQNTTTAVELVQ
jgi:hypothetical protein